MLAHAGQSEATRHADPDAIATLCLCLGEAIKDKDPTRDRRRTRDTARYDELPDAG